MAATVQQADGSIVLAENASATPTVGKIEAATTESTGVAPEAHGGKKVFPPLDTATFLPQLIWFALTFGALYWLLSRVALPRVSSVIEARAAHIKRDLDEAERLKGETARALAEYEKALADAKSKANGIAQQTRDSLKTYVDQQRAKVDQDIADKTSAAEAQILAAKQSAMGNVGAIATDTAEAILARLINTPISRDEIASALRAVRS